MGAPCEVSSDRSRVYRAFRDFQFPSECGRGHRTAKCGGRGLGSGGHGTLIATSSARHTVEHHLTAHNLAGRFHEIVGHGDYASGKPAPDPFLKAAERLGVKPRLCLALEDSHNGIRSASSAGMMTVMVPDLLEPTDEIRGLCTFVARDLLEVRSLINVLRAVYEPPLNVMAFLSSNCSNHTCACF
jgi:phosphoglycolate phosphatase-like HAD superfamily hydrolase